MCIKFELDIYELDLWYFLFLSAFVLTGSDLFTDAGAAGGVQWGAGIR